VVGLGHAVFKPMQKYKKGVMIVCQFLRVWLNSVKWCFYGEKLQFKVKFSRLQVVDVGKMKQRLKARAALNPVTNLIQIHDPWIKKAPNCNCLIMSTLIMIYT
jgi:hypothetical protein